MEIGIILLYLFKQQKSSRCYVPILLLLCSLFLFPPSANAARKKVIFQLANFRHWTDLEYDYTGKSDNYDNGGDRNSQEHEFAETYHLEIDYAILDSDLANGSLSVDLGLLQSYGNESGENVRSDNSNGFIGGYLFDMIAFERRFYPVSLTSSLTQERITAPFTDNYDQTHQAWSAAITLRNSYLLSSLNYYYNTMETSGLTNDRTQENEVLSLSANSTIGDFSETRLDAETSSRRTDYSDNTQSSTQTDTDELGLQNFLRWGSLREKNSLNSRYRFTEDTGTSERKTHTWDEDLKLQLGKALTTEFSYGYRSDESPNQEQKQHNGDASIEHQLFDSLTTRVGYSVDQTDYLIGDEQNWHYQAELTYRKKLPGESRLGMSCNYLYGKTDRDLDENQLTIIDEGFPVTVFLAGFLEHLDIITESIVVYNADRSIIYNLDTDYRINTIGRRTELEIIGGGIVAGDILSVDYLYQVNNSIKYSTTGYSLSTNVSLFANRYRLYGSLSKTDQDKIAGVDSVSPLIQQTYAQIGLDGNFDSISLGTSYTYLDSNLSTDKTTEAFVSYLLRKNRSHLSLRLTERYTTTQQNEENSGNAGGLQNRNSLTFNADYRRRLYSNLTMSLRGHVIDIRSQNQDQDDIFLGMVLESRWYKFELQLSADVTWQLYKDSSSREDTVSFRIRRYF